MPAEECQVEPRAADELFALIGLVEGGQVSPAAAHARPGAALDRGR